MGRGLELKKLFRLEITNFKPKLKKRVVRMVIVVVVSSHSTLIIAVLYLIQQLLFY